MKMSLKINSVRGKALLAIIMVALLSMLVGSLIVSRVVEKQITANYEVARRTTIEGLSYSLAPVLELYDYELVERIITAILKHHYIASIAVYDQNGTLIRSVKEETTEAAAVGSEKYAITSDGRPVGSLEVGFYTGYIYDQARSTTLAFVFVLAGVFILVILFIFKLVDRLVTRPLRFLTEKVTEITPDNLSVRIEPTGDDEFGLVARGFNRMVNNLEKGMAAVMIHSGS
ncbi:MAG: HAMP domain-containing protein, partial [Chloroflexota bacterium]